MLEVLTTFRQRLETLPDKIPEMLQEIFKEIAHVVEDENILQLQHGQRPDGTFLPDYSYNSVHIFGKPPGPMRMHDTGDFYKGITLIVQDAGIELKGMDIKTEMLELHYGDLVGLSEESLEDLKNNYLIELLQEKIIKYLTA